MDPILLFQWKELKYAVIEKFLHDIFWLRMDKNRYKVTKYESCKAGAGYNIYVQMNKTYMQIKHRENRNKVYYEYKHKCWFED